MQVADGLTGVVTAVGDQAVTRTLQPLLLRDRGRCADERRKLRVAEATDLVQAVDMRFRHQHHMGRGLRVDIPEGIASIVLEHLRAGDLTGDDFAE